MADIGHRYSRKEILERLSAILCDVFSLKKDDIDEDLKVGDSPKWDSLGHLTLFLQLESRMNVRFSAQEIIACRSVCQIADRLEEKLSR